MTEKEIIELIKQDKPFEGFGGIRVLGIEAEPWQDIPDKNARPDVVITLEFSGNQISFYGEIKTQITPRTLREVASLLIRLNLNSPTKPYILIVPFLSPESQKYCQENNLGFIDMCGNVFINIPGRVLIQRFNRPNIFKTPRLLRNPFGGTSSRVLRVLLQSPMPRKIDSASQKSPVPLQPGQWWNLPKQGWSVTDIEKELIQESANQDRVFQISLSSISKTVDSLTESLLIRRDGLKIVVPEPKQMLFRWAEKYQERYKWMRRSSWLCNNPFGFDLKSSIAGLLKEFPKLDVIITGTAAASLNASFANIDRIELFLMNNKQDDALRTFTLKTEKGKGPEFLFIRPNEPGVAMYAQKINGLNTVANIQAYLDCYARGGRDAKQAEYLLTNKIEKDWAKQ